MSNDPWPSNRTLRIEAIANRLQAEQAASVAKFRKLLAAFAADFDKLHFPLGDPAKGYPAQHINDYIAEWMVGDDDDDDRAMDAAERVAEDEDDRIADHRFQQMRDDRMEGAR